MEPACIASIIGGSKDGVAQGMYRRTTQCLALVRMDIHIFSFLAGFKGGYAENRVQCENGHRLQYVVIILVGFYRNIINKSRSLQMDLFRAQEMI